MATRTLTTIARTLSAVAGRVRHEIEARRTAAALRRASPERREDLGLTLRDVSRLA